RAPGALAKDASHPAALRREVVGSSWHLGGLGEPSGDLLCLLHREWSVLELDQLLVPPCDPQDPAGPHQARPGGATARGNSFTRPQTLQAPSWPCAAPCARAAPPPRR